MNTREIGKQIARDTAGTDSFDTLNAFDRSIVGENGARITIPLLNGTQTVGALKLIVQELTKLIVNVEPMPDERAKLLAVGSSVRHLNKRVNCFRQKGSRRF